MKIDKYLRTTYNGCEYITAYKLYRVLFEKDRYNVKLVRFIPDDGNAIQTKLCASAHLDGYNWTLLDTVSAGMSGWL